MVLWIVYSERMSAMENAKRFIDLIEAGKLKKQTLPNTAPDYSQCQEKKDLDNYRFFANSFALDEIMNCEVSSYNGDEQI